MQYPLIEEIKKADCYRVYALSNPIQAQRFLARIEKDLPEQWKSMELYKQMYKDGKFKDAMPIGDGRQSGVMPECYSTWATFSRPKDIPAKDWLKRFIRLHPELWLEDNAYTGKIDKNI